MSNDPKGKDTLTLVFNEEQWRAIYKEIPGNQPLREILKDVTADAMTFGEVEYEFRPDELAVFKKYVGFDWVDEAIALAEAAARRSETLAAEKDGGR